MIDANIQSFEGQKADPIDLTKLIRVIWNKIWLVVGTALAGALLSLLITFFFISPKYQSSVMFYVNNNSFSLGDAAVSISPSDISASRGLVDSYIVILKARETLLDVIDYADVNLRYADLNAMLKAAAVSDTEIFRVVVTSEDPQEAVKIAEAIAYILPKRISSIIEGSSAKIVDSAVLPAAPSSPSYLINALAGFLVGALLSAGAIILWAIMDTTIRSEEDILQNCKYPVLSAVPDMEAVTKSGSYYSYDTERKKQLASGRKNALIGKEISFAAAEAYKLLRTKLLFSFTDDSKSHIVGISSALSGEGKSVSAINLANTLSQLGKRVILIDCDMRRPALAERLRIHKTPGLSDFLTGQINADQLIQSYGTTEDENAFFVVSAGQNPPNPIELLSSKKMKALLNRLRDLCDYVILDLPPVNEVSDALAVAGQTDGILLVVRQDLCNRVVLNHMIRQFEFLDAKILGVVFNCVTENGGKYGYTQKYYNAYSPKKRSGHFGKSPKAGSSGRK